MGISTITALEIFTNPRDLEITIGQDKNSGKFAIGIFRGPGHNFKPILTSQAFAEKLEDAIEATKETLESVRQAMIKNLADPRSLLSQQLNPDGQEIDQSKVLNPDLINQILDELRQRQVASTHKMLVPAR